MFTKFTWDDGSLSLYNAETKVGYKVCSVTGRTTRLVRSATNRHINGGMRYKTMKTAKELALVADIIANAVATN